MPITYGEAKLSLARYAERGGKCPSAPEVDLFVRKVLQQMLYKGTYGNLRKFCFNARKGCITLPYELETPVKVKIDSKVGTVWDKWFEYYNIGEMEGCIPASSALYEEPNRFPIVYDLPVGGARIGALATASEDKDAHIIIQGIDPTGREIFTNHKGEKITGEYISLIKGSLRYSEVAFASVTNIYKTRTNGYVQLYWLRPELNQKGFLADYSPGEEIPSYRRFKLTNPNYCTTNAQVSILGRIRLKDSYADNDVIPFDNILALELAGQSINASFNDQVDLAAAKSKMMEATITEETEYRRVNGGQPVDIMYLTSAGSIRGIV